MKQDANGRSAHALASGNANSFTPSRSAWLMTTTWRGAPRIMLSPDDGGGAAGAGAGAAGGGGGNDGGAAGGAAAGGAGGSAGGSLSGQNGGGQAAGGAGGVTPYRPEGLPDHLLGANDKETLDKVVKAYGGARQALGDRGAVPENPDGYKLEFGDKVKPYTSNFDKDPVFKGTLKIAHEAGITDKQLNAFLPRMLESLVEGGMVEKPIDAKAALMSLAPAGSEKLAEPERMAAATARMNNNIAWVDGAKAQGTIPKDVADYLAATLADNPNAHHLVEWMRGNSRERGPALGGNGGGGTGEADVKARLTDKRYGTDKAFTEETDRMSQQIWGN